MTGELNPKDSIDQHLNTTRRLTKKQWTDLILLTDFAFGFAKRMCGGMYPYPESENVKAVFEGVRRVVLGKLYKCATQTNRAILEDVYFDDGDTDFSFDFREETDNILLRGVKDY